MTPKELQKLFDFLNVIPFREPVDDNAQKKYNLAFKDLQEKVKIQNNRFFIDHDSFAKVVIQAFENGAKYLKIHLIKETKDLNVNIGFSFSTLKTPKDFTIDYDLDFFWTLNDNGLLVESKKEPFTIYKTNFQETFSELVRQSTNQKCTEFIQYDIKDVIRYMLRNFLSNTFESKKFILNFFVFKEYATDPKLNDRIGISVHNTLTLIEEGKNKKELSSIGYDFGTVYP